MIIKCSHCLMQFNYESNTEESNRLFDKSDYEKEFENKLIFNYRGIDIYWYINNILDSTNFTYWYGPENSEYMSGIATLDDAKKSIDLHLNNRSK